MNKRQRKKQVIKILAEKFKRRDTTIWTDYFRNSEKRYEKGTVVERGSQKYLTVVFPDGDVRKVHYGYLYHSPSGPTKEIGFLPLEWWDMTFEKLAEEKFEGISAQRHAVQIRRYLGIKIK